jgi:uncharacterized delta-60 repeat protein
MPELGIFLGAITNRAYGYTTPARWEFNGNVYAITPEVNPSNGEPTGKIYVGGAFTKYNDITVNRIVKLNIDGTIDTSFNTGNGFNSTAANPVNSWGQSFAPAVYAILQESGSSKIYVCGVFTNYSASVISANRIIRLNLNGTLDTTFASGITSTQYGSSGYLHTMCHVSGSNQIYVGGRTVSSTGGIARLNSNGTIDNSFNTGTGDTKGFSSGIVYSIIQASGSDKIYVGGNFVQYSGSAAVQLSANNIARLNSNGTRDLTFSASFSGNSGFIALARESGSDKIYVGGAFTSYANSNAANPATSAIPARLIRLNSDGSRDTSFLAGTGGGMGGNVFSIIQVPNSTDIYLGGAFISYTTGSNIFTQNRISRLTSTASTSSLANFGTGFNSTVYALAPSGSNGLYVGGAFNGYQGSTVNYFVKLIPSS